MSEQESSQPEYKAKAVSVEAILNNDKADASLDAYKQKLLGGSLVDGKAAAKYPDDPRKVIVESIKLVFDDPKAPQQEVIIPVDKADQTIAIKEGVSFTVWANFYVQHDIVLGLQLIDSTTKLGVEISRETTMLGTFAPQLSMYSIRCNQHEAPSGWLSRTTFSMSSTLTDDDNNKHVVINFSISIQKDW